MTSGIAFSQEEIDVLKKGIVDMIIEGKDVPLYIACQHHGLGVSTCYAWRKLDPDWDAEIEAARKISVENGLDFSESILMKNIAAEKEASVFFHLKTRGKHRGYIERVDHGGVQGQPIQHTHTLATKEEAADFYKQLSEI